MQLEELTEKYTSLYPEVAKIYGPFYRKSDGRKQLNFRLKDGSMTSKQYAKALYEAYHGVRLSKEQTVDHINNDKTDDNIDNLQILSRSENSKKSNPIQPNVILTCYWCKCNFEVTAKNMNYRNRCEAGPFCSKVCSGKYGSFVQKGS